MYVHVVYNHTILGICKTACNSVDFGHVTSPPHVLFMLGIHLCEKDNNSNNYNCTETAIITKRQQYRFKPIVYVHICIQIKA